MGRCRLVGGLGGSFGALCSISAHDRVQENLLVLTVVFASFPITCLRADEKPLSAPRPTKDAMASKNHAQGAGIFEMMVDKPSGKVQVVYVRSSTKNLFLDADVINTFLQWRFTPNKQSSVPIVVTFTGDNDTAFIQ